MDVVFMKTNNTFSNMSTVYRGYTSSMSLFSMPFLMALIQIVWCKDLAQMTMTTSEC